MTDDTIDLNDRSAFDSAGYDSAGYDDAGYDSVGFDRTAAPTAVHATDFPSWRDFPLRWRDVRILLGVYVVLTAVYTLVGLAIVEWWEPSAFGQADADVNRWLEDGRTDFRSRLAELGSALSNTETKIVLALGLLPLMLWMYRRWHDWALLAVGLLLEVSIFGTSSKLVVRERPPVEQLDGAPTHSWPSGHIAAATVFYVGLALIIFWNSRSRLSRVVAVIVAVGAPSAVILARLYQGMHYVSDAVGGVVLGLICLAIVRALLMQAGLRSSQEALTLQSGGR